MNDNSLVAKQTFQVALADYKIPLKFLAYIHPDRGGMKSAFNFVLETSQVGTNPWFPYQHHHHLHHLRPALVVCSLLAWWLVAL